MSKVVLITGCSSGIGLSLAVLLASTQQYKVYATLRDPSKATDLTEAAKDVNKKYLVVKALDVASESSSKACVEEILQIEGKIDVLVNNAGFSVAGTIENLSMDAMRNQFETNLFGAIRLMQLVVPSMRKQKSGRVLNISSVGGINGVPFNDIYCASKFALEGLSESMASLYKSFGVDIILIEPGAIVTNFLHNAKRDDISETPMDPQLKEQSDKYLAVMLPSMHNGQTPLQVAEVMKKAIEDPTPHLRYQTSELATQVAKAKLIDSTGDTTVQAMRNRFFK